MTGFTPESAAALAGPDWLRERRRSAAERFLGAEMPTDALEEWRYSRIAEVRVDRFAPAGPPSEKVGGDDAASRLASAIGEATVVETLDGHLVSVTGPGSRPLEVVDLSAGDGADIEERFAGEEPDPFVTLNAAFAPSPLLLRVPRRSDAGTVVVIHRGAAQGAAVLPRLLVDLGESSEASVVEVFAGGTGSLVAPVSDLRVADAARLAYTTVQMLDAEAFQIGFQRSEVGRDATLVSAAVAIGGDYARLRTDSSLVAPGASGRLLAVYFGSLSQMHDFRTVQHHRAAKTQSELLYKGAVANTARSVYSGLIRVDKGARGTNAMQTNRNLVLHDGAHADSVPNLEIEDNDVRCTHASAVGPIAEDQRFYLESRGVPSAVADRLISVGFLDEILMQLPVPALAAPLRAALARKLTGAEAEEERRRAAFGAGPEGSAR